MTLTKYNRAELTISDHKPIYAHFKVKINKVDEKAKALVEENLVAKFNAIKINQRKQQQLEKQMKHSIDQNSGAAVSDADFASEIEVASAETPFPPAPLQASQDDSRQSNLSMAEPKLGDLGLLEENEAVRSDSCDEVDDAMVRNINRERSNLYVRDAELQEFIRSAQVNFSEE